MIREQKYRSVRVTLVTHDGYYIVSPMDCTYLNLYNPQGSEQPNREEAVLGTGSCTLDCASLTETSNINPICARQPLYNLGAVFKILDFFIAYLKKNQAAKVFVVEYNY